jgi:glycosyltransferase involved in cell wall biosynthesis
MIHIVGIVGVPSKYGGFETLVEYLLDSKKIIASGVTVYCEKEICHTQGCFYKGAKLAPIRWKANGWQSVLYDLNALWIASRNGGSILILGTSATFIIPILKVFFPQAEYIVNMAGLEWSRAKFNIFGRFFLKFNEKVAAQSAHKFITDNQGLTDYIETTYGKKSQLIPYGGDQFLTVESNQKVFDEFHIPKEFDFAMARSQVDNNMEIILEAYSKNGYDLVFVSNWFSSKYGKKIYNKYSKIKNIYLIGPIYDIEKIKALHQRTRLYIHGHSAGGTNPVLVESMWAKLPILAFDVSFNRHTTENKAFYFKTSSELTELVTTLEIETILLCANMLFSTANRKYKWEYITTAYEKILLNDKSK